MRKDYLILIVSLAILAVSGAIIFAIQGSNTKSPAASPHEASNQMQIPPAADSLQTQKEIEMMENRLKSDPNDHDALVDLGNAYYDISNAPKAIEYYERALKIRPNDPPVIVDMGAMYRQSGNADKALELFNKAIAIDPKLPQAYFNLGMVYRMEKNDPANAAKAWRKYLKLDPNSQAKGFLEQQIKATEGGG